MASPVTPQAASGHLVIIIHHLEAVDHVSTFDHPIRLRHLPFTLQQLNASPDKISRTGLLKAVAERVETLRSPSDESEGEQPQTPQKLYDRSSSLPNEPVEILDDDTLVAHYAFQSGPGEHKVPCFIVTDDVSFIHDALAQNCVVISQPHGSQVFERTPVIKKKARKMQHEDEQVVRRTSRRAAPVIKQEKGEEELHHASDSDF